MSKLKTLKDCLIEELKDLYSAEKQLVKALPKMEKKASNENLKKAFKMHLEETKKQVDRLDEISSILEKKLTGKTCKAMKGLVEEASEILEEESENEALIDIQLVGAAQRVEHYEISAYGTTIALAEELEMKKIVKLLTQTLKEEGNADEKLTSLTQKELFKEAKMNEKSDDEADEPRRKSKGRDAVHAALVGAMVFAGSTLSNYGEVKAEHTPEHAKARSSMKAETDNTAVNKIDRMNNGITAEDQNNDSGNIQVLANIRKAITEDDSLSVNAHNVKVIVDNGKVYLKGPVDSRAEKEAIRTIATSQAANFEVVDSITVEK